MTGPRPFGCGVDHGPGEGGIDEAARRLSHEEFAVARALADDGHQVRALRERPGQGRQPDLEVCGARVEVKSWDPDRSRPPTPPSVWNKLRDAAGQAEHVVLYGKGCGLTAAVARRGLAMWSSDPAGGHLRSVRVLGDGFDLAWAPRPVLARGRPRPLALGL